MMIIQKLLSKLRKSQYQKAEKTFGGDFDELQQFRVDQKKGIEDWFHFFKNWNIPDDHPIYTGLSADGKRFVILKYKIIHGSDIISDWLFIHQTHVKVNANWQIRSIYNGKFMYKWLHHFSRLFIKNLRRNNHQMEI